MIDYLLQDWSTFTSAYTQTTLIQTETDWVSFQAFSDIVLWLEVRGVVVSTGGTAVQMIYETAPAKDESLFKEMVTAFTMTASATPDVKSVILSQAPSVPLARWVRWKLKLTGSPTAGDWGATFRLHAVANPSGVV